VSLTSRLAALRDAMGRDLRENVLPFWLGRVLDRRTGFHGFLNECGVADPLAPMGSVLCARLLWTFSAAYRATGDPAHRSAAEHFYSWLTERFIDDRYGGVFWMLDHAGRPIEERKQTYALAFAVYALAEHRLATGAAEALERALAVQQTLEAHARDAERGGATRTRTRPSR
jgi:mannobiose 2-epimerase